MNLYHLYPAIPIPLVKTTVAATTNLFQCVKSATNQPQTDGSATNSLQVLSATTATKNEIDLDHLWMSCQMGLLEKGSVRNVPVALLHAGIRIVMMVNFPATCFSNVMLATENQSENEHKSPRPFSFLS